MFALSTIHSYYQTQYGPITGLVISGALDSLPLRRKTFKAAAEDSLSPITVQLQVC